MALSIVYIGEIAMPTKFSYNDMILFFLFIQNILIMYCHFHQTSGNNLGCVVFVHFGEILLRTTAN